MIVVRLPLIENVFELSSEHISVSVFGVQLFVCGGFLAVIGILKGILLHEVLPVCNFC